MAGIGDVGILFKIKADSDQAEREFKKFKKELDDIDERGKDPLQRLASQAGLTAAQFSGLQTAVLGATAIIGTISVAAIAAVTAIARLTVATSEYGSQLYDASIKTGLSAKSISALKLAADTGGSSLESITGSVAKLNVLVGQAANDNEKAAKTLRDWGITATDTNEAFEQAVSVIGSMTDQGQKNAAAMALFKDRSGQVLGVIDQMNGDFKAFIATAEKLGLTLTEQDLKAADDFGDTLDILGKQAKAAGQQFALELMPNVTHAMKTISGEMEGNSSVARSWGRVVGDIVRGLEIAVLDLRTTFQIQFAGINAILGTNVSATIDWANAILPSLGIVGQTLAALRLAGQANPLGAGQMGGSFNPSAAIPNISRGGGRGGGGGGGGSDPAADAEKRRREAVEAAQKTVDDTLAIYKVGYEEREAALEAFLQRGEILEIEKIRDVARIRLEALMDEKRLTEGLLSNSNITLNEKERAEILQKIKILIIQIRVEKLKGGTEINAQVKKEIADAEKQLEIERERLETERKRRNERNKAASNSLLDKEKAEIDRLAAEKKNSQRLGGGGTQWEELFKFLQGNNQFKDNSALIAGIEVMRSAFEGLAQAIGQVVQAWVLYGSAGTSVKQVTAQILAGIAQQAAVKAIFELAEGFAALARAFFGDPKAGAEAAMHFKSAATYGIVAGVAAVAGRGVAGNSFNQTAGSAGSGGGVGNGASQQNNNFTTRFNGFGNAMGEQIRQQNQVIAALEETITRFDRKFNTASPGAVVMAGANEASRAIVGALHSEYSDNPASVDGTMRNLGFAR